MSLLQETIKSLKPLDQQAMTLAQARQDRLTKPLGSLGTLESLSVQVAGIVGNPKPAIGRKVIVVAAGDHGIAAEGVSAYPQEVTCQMVENFLRGKAAINVLARHVGAEVVVVDTGICKPVPGTVDRRIRAGTDNFLRGPAMSQEEAVRAIESGIGLATDQADEGATIIGTGDMGIGNTTSCSAIVAALTGKPVSSVVGSGTGVVDGSLAHKREVIERSISLGKPDMNDALDVLTKVGGFEIGALAGCIIGAAANRVPVVIDGFISGTAALLAGRLAPLSISYMIASHLSTEPGHAVILRDLGLAPMLIMDMRLGEGTGAALAINLVEAACRLLSEMATFEEAGVSTADK